MKQLTFFMQFTFLQVYQTLIFVIAIKEHFVHIAIERKIDDANCRKYYILVIIARKKPDTIILLK